MQVRSLLCLVSSLTALLVFAPRGWAADVFGHVNVDTTWYASQSPYVLHNDVDVDPGVTLIIELQLQVIRSRRFFIDDVDAELAVRYELEYSPVTQRYIVRNVNSGDQDSFATLYSALNSLGRVQGLPVIDDALLAAESEYRVRLRAMLNTERYPAALRVLFFWRGQWQLQSEWFEWLLER